MNDRDFFVQRQEAELPAFLKVLRAIPAEQLSYKPHERSPSTEQLVWTLTAEFETCVTVARDYRGAWSDVAPPPLGDMISRFERAAVELRSEVSRMDEAAWTKPAKFFVGEKMVLEQPAGTFLWFILFDAIHHRGQLSTYLRPMGAKVPAIYGPSADDHGS